MTTPPKIAAARRNGLRSTGPRTPAGKAASSLNATRHGVLFVSPVVPGFERRQDWERHWGAILAALTPQGALEDALAERVASLLWRLGRVVRYETQSIVQGLETARHELAEAARLAVRFDPAKIHPEEAGDFAKDAAKRRAFSKAVNTCYLPPSTACFWGCGSVLCRPDAIGSMI